MRLALLVLFSVSASALAAVEPAVSPFEKNIAAYEASDRQAPPTSGTIEFIGSSTFTRWSTLKEDFAPLPVFNRAFGGSGVNDVLRAVPRLVLPYKPRVIVYYCGDNNMAQADRADPRVPVKGFTDFLAAVRTELPQVRVVYAGIKPSPARWAAWPKVQEANAAIRELCATDPALTFVDLAPVFLGADGLPRAELYVKDQLHANAQGYAGITAALTPAVKAAWAAAGGAP